MFKDRNLSSDLGLVYVNHFTNDAGIAIGNTQNLVLLENNLMYGAYAYGNDARGIFIDDGRGDVTCRNNVVLDCQRYSIDSRDARSYVPTSSIRNRLENNCLGTPFRLAAGEGVPEKDRPTQYGNVMLTDGQNIITRTKCEPGQIDSRVVLDARAITKGDKVAISRNAKKVIRRTGVYEKNRGRFVVRKTNADDNL